MESILTSVKKVIGLDENYTAFDTDIIIAINTALFTLWQLRVGINKASPYKITGKTETWNDFIEDGKIEMCKSYVVLRVRLLFDPPTSGFLVDAIKEQIREFEFRMIVGSDEYEFSLS